MPPRCANAPSAAKLFVQLSSSSRHSQGAVLDVFLPRQTRAFRTAASSVAVCPSFKRTTISQYGMRLQQQQQQQLCAGLPRRLFSTSGYRQRTQAILNPQVDEDGKEMMLEITPRAAQRLTKIMTKDQNPHLALRIQVESGGCHGFQYRMGLVTLPESMTASKPATSDASSPEPPSPETEAEMAPSTTTTTEPLQSDLSEDDTIFAFAQEEAASDSLATAPKIVLDGPSLDLLKGSKLDFTMELIGSQFKIVDNPAATSSCGCGTSFDIKM